MNEIKIYGIPNCNSVKKALDWCDKHKVKYTFHNYKKEPADAYQIKNWSKLVGWETLFNKKGTTWRSLAEKYKDITLTEKIAIELMLENNSIIKRPVIEYGKKIIVGYDEEQFKLLLKK